MLTALQLTNFISLQKRATLRMVEMNNDELILFAEARITSSYIDLQKEAINKIYTMNVNELEIFLRGGVTLIK